MKKVDSSSNPRIKNVRKILAGKDRAHWIIEGKRLFREAKESDVRFVEIFVSQQTWDKDFAKEFGSDEVVLVPNKLMAEISSLETPPGILAIASRRTISEPTLKQGFAAFAWSVRDPGNLGTLVRTAEATGCRFIACSPDCVDAYSPKVLRASMGSLFRIPVFSVMEPENYLADQSKKSVLLYGLVPHSGANIFETKLREPAMIILGGEVAGVPDKLKPDFKISIPMDGRVESLNVGVAASIAFYQFSKALAK